MAVLPTVLPRWYHTSITAEVLIVSRRVTLHLPVAVAVAAAAVVVLLQTLPLPPPLPLQMVRY